MSYDVMLSYSSKDGEFAENIYTHLITNGVNTFYAPRSIKVGETWPAKIGKAMEECSLAVLIFSKNANNSEQVEREFITLKDHLKKRILVINKDNTPPQGTFLYYLPSLHQIFYKSDEETLPIVFSNIKEFLSQNAADNLETHKKSGVEQPPLAIEFTKNEQKYINKLRKFLEDGNISDIEREKLSDAIPDFEISLERAKELEELVKKELGMPEQALSMLNEQKYLNKLRKVLEDKEITDDERQRLAEWMEDFDIPPTLAKELEEQVRKELGIVELTPVQEGTTAEIIAEEGSLRDIAEHFVDDLNKKYESHLKAIDSKFELDPNGLKIMFDYSVGYSCKFVFEFQKEFMNCSLWDWCRNDYPIAGSKDFFGAWFDNECANDFPNYEWNKRRLYGYLVFWQEEFSSDASEPQLFSDFKKRVFSTLDVLFSKLQKLYNESSSLLSAVTGLTGVIDGLVTALKIVFPVEEGWVVDENAKQMSGDSGISVYKTAWEGKPSFRIGSATKK